MLTDLGDQWDVLEGADHEMDLRFFVTEVLKRSISELIVALLVPRRDIPRPSFRFHHMYEECSILMTVGEIVAQGGICFVFRGSVIFTTETPLIFTKFLEYCSVYQACKDATPTTFDLIRQALLYAELDKDYLDIIYHLGHSKDFQNLSIGDVEGFNILPSSSDEQPAFVQAKKQQLEKRRDWSKWDQLVCATG